MNRRFGDTEIVIIINEDVDEHCNVYVTGFDFTSL